MREGIQLPEFADRFFRFDADAEPMPVISLYPIPAPLSLESVHIDICGLDQHPLPIAWDALADLPRVKLKVPLICQIFNWSEEVEWEGVRLVDVLDYLKADTAPEGYFSFYSRDRVFFEGLSRDEARDPRVLLAIGLNGAPLPIVHGGPIRLVVPFLQGYKSVKWLRAIHAYRHDPVGIKRLLGHSAGSRLNEKWRTQHQVLIPPGRPGDPDPFATKAALAQAVTTPSQDKPLESAVDVLEPVSAKAGTETRRAPEAHASVETLKEVIAILRPEKHRVTRAALEAAGITSYTTYGVLGRSHQRGLRFQSDQEEGVAIKFLPKQYFSIVIPAARLSAAIAVIMKANRSGKGAVGDGRIFVCDVEGAVRISSDERGGQAAQ